MTTTRSSLARRQPMPPFGKHAPIAHAVAVALACLAATSAHAQDATLTTVTVDERSAPRQADVTGFGDLPLSQVPVSATVIDSRQMQDRSQ